MLALLRHLPEAATWSALFSWRAAADMVVGFGLFLAVRRAFAGRSLRPLALALLAGLCATLLVGLAARTGLVSLLGYRPMASVGLAVDERLRAFFFASTRLAEYIVIATPFALTALIGVGGWPRRLRLPLAGLILAGLGLTLQRGGWVAGAVQLAFLAVVVGWRWRRDAAALRQAALTAAATLVFTVSIFAAGGARLERLTERVEGAVSGIVLRVPLWVAAVEMVRDRPLLGQGVGTFAPAYDRLQQAGLAEEIPFRASGHQLYLQLAAERGLLGLLTLGLLGGAAVLCLRRPRAGQEGLVLGLAASLLGVAVYGLVQNLFQLRINGWLIWIVLGCVTLATRPRDSPNVRRAAWTLVWAAVLVLPFRFASERPEFAGTREFGLHEMERATGGFRWTDGLAVQRLGWAGETLVLTLVDGHPRAARRQVEVLVGVDGETVARLTASGSWQEHRIELGPPRKQWILLTLRVRPTFRPFSDYRRYPEMALSLDHRSLGVAIREPRWE